MALDQVDTQLDEPTVPNLEELDTTVEAAIRSGEPRGLRVLGYGEVTLVLGWPTAQPTVAVKRLPVFRDHAQFDRYRDLLTRYTAELARRGVGVLPTAVRSVETAGELHAYLVQPLVPRGELLNNLLRAAGAERGYELLETLVHRVCDAVDHRVGLDAQAANWAVRVHDLFDVDVSTPMLRGEDGRSELDVPLFVSIYPWALRGMLRPIARSVMNDFHQPRQVLVDVASNLVKEGLERWLPTVLGAANERVSPAITEVEVQRYLVRDRRLWLSMQRMRRADRAWQRRVRRRPYPFLLPPPYRYGPQELEQEGDHGRNR